MNPETTAFQSKIKRRDHSVSSSRRTLGRFADLLPFEFALEFRQWSIAVMPKVDGVLGIEPSGRDPSRGPNPAEDPAIIGHPILEILDRLHHRQRLLESVTPKVDQTFRSHGREPEPVEMTSCQLHDPHRTLEPAHRGRDIHRFAVQHHAGRAKGETIFEFLFRPVQSGAPDAWGSSASTTASRHR